MIRSRETMAALLRQRRFLVLMSLALAGYYVLKVQVRGEAEYSGLAVALQRPARVQYCLWIVFLWALLRYVQRLVQLWRRVQAQLLTDADDQDRRLALRAMRRYAVWRVAREGVKNFPEPRAEGNVWIEASIKESIRQLRAPLASAPPKAKQDPWFIVTNVGGRKYRAFSIEISYTRPDGRRNSTGHNFQMPDWGGLRTRVHRVRAWIRAAIRLPSVSEHLAPLALAAAAAIAAILMIVFDHAPGGLGG
jgi:hypothetical protein